jgi:hypothetical protein
LKINRDCNRKGAFRDAYAKGQSLDREWTETDVGGQLDFEGAAATEVKAVADGVIARDVNGALNFDSTQDFRNEAV